jgi:hypothetical protein
MESCLILPGLERSLLRRGLPRDYVRRAIDELDAHCGDVASSDRRSDTALAVTDRVVGDAAQLGQRLVSDYRAARFAGRHPLLAFVVAPLPVTLLVWALSLALGAAIAGGIAWLAGEHSAWTFTAMEFLHRLTAIAPQILTGWWFWRLSARSGWGRAWALPACGLVALTWWLFESRLVLPTSPGNGQFSVGVGGSVWLLLPCVLITMAAWRLLHSDRRWAAA